MRSEISNVTEIGLKEFFTGIIIMSVGDVACLSLVNYVCSIHNASKSTYSAQL